MLFQDIFDLGVLMPWESKQSEPRIMKDNRRYFRFAVYIYRKTLIIVYFDDSAASADDDDEKDNT